MNPDAVVLRDSVLECENLKMVYDQGSDQVHVLDNLQLNIVKGERVAIVGTSGSGKTTLLNLLGGLDDPTAGLVRVKGQDMALLNESQRATWRNQHLGFVYQFHHLLAEFSALENVAMPLLIGRYPANQARQIAAEILDRVSLSHRYQHKPAELSGGERQRVAIARALVTRPDCVLMDEPTGNLDPKLSAEIMRLFELFNQVGVTVLVATHDLALIARLNHRILTLQKGRLINDGR